jgi:hypothetical protein
MRAGIVNHASAETSSRFGVARTRTSLATGVIIAPPMPWTKRASTNSPSDPAAAQPIEPMAKTAMASLKMTFAPNLSATHELIGMKMASETR